MEIFNNTFTNSKDGCSICKCSLCGKGSNNFGCCNICRQSCDCAGCAFQLGKATSDDSLRIIHTNLASKYAIVKNHHLRFIKSANYNENRNYIKDKVLQCITSRK